ncbi:MAG: cyclic nucleotide-binding domain-containing protein [Proteobacteria bacterium]|nr:cyclic nucleotide-binding domain-containing protein [Pseudomonadota bacterium]
MNKDVTDFLSNISPFSKLPEKELRQTSESVSISIYPKDSVLAVQNITKIENVCIIKEGLVELFFDKQGKKVLSGFMKEGDIFGGISILMNAGISIRTAKVYQDSTVYLIPKKKFLDLCTRFKVFYEYFVEAFSRRMLDESYAAIISEGQAFQFLKGIVPFSFLPEEEIERVASELSTVYYPQNTVLFIQGESRVGYLYIIQKGAAERYFEDKGRKSLIGVLGEGDLYGGISMLLNDGLAVRTLKTNEHTYFYILPQKKFLDVCKNYEAFSDYFTDTFGKRMLDKSYAEIIAKNIQPKEEALQFLNQPVSAVTNSRLVYCGIDASIQDAASIMSKQGCSSIFVKESSGKFIGVVTDNDLRKKVIAKGYDIKLPAADIMSSPLCKISGQSLVFEALMAMMQHNIKHIAVTDTDGKVTGIVTNRDLLTAQGQSPFFVVREIITASSIDEIIDKHKRLPKLIQTLINNGAKAKNVTRFITTVSDTILNKIIGFAINDLGSPPAPFVFMIMGSEGRKEQTLKTDQDNAIIYDDFQKDKEDEVREYFLNFGEKVCTWLDMAGYEFCKGDIMAKNPKWCQPLSVWKKYFNSWIHTAEAEDLLKSSIFFDFRCAYGDSNLTGQLKKYLLKSLGGWAGFFRHLSENALYFKPPIGFFRNFVVESKGEHRDALDIKSAMTPIVDFARIYALKNGIEETNTQERLYQLYLKNILTWQDYNEIDQSYSFMMQLRFVRQVASVIDEKSKHDNYINPKKLSRMEQTMLKEIFKKIERIQVKLSFDFIGIP